MTSTLITGSTAAGEVFPPHIQFQTKAKSKDTQRLNAHVIKYAQRVKGKFGCAEVRTWPITFGLNEKGGMDNEEFEKYIRGAILPLFPDVEDKPGKRVLLKVDSGPGRCNLKLLVALRLLGVYLYPCVPNTTHVSQETDQCYGPFKTQFLQNLTNVFEGRLNANESTSLTPTIVGLPLFGGVDITGMKVMTGAFQYAFVPSRCLAAWSKVGAVTPEGRITRACVNNPQVLKELGDDMDTDRLYYAVQNANEISVLALHNAGYDAQWLTATLKKKKEEEETVCVPYSPSKVELLAKACGHGGRFHATNGMHLTADEIFIAEEMKSRQEERVALEKEKKVRMAQEDIEKKAVALLEQEGRTIESYSVKDLDVLLGWHQLKITGWKKEQKLAKWKDVVESLKQPPSYAKWTDEDEQRLVVLQCDVNGIGDTMFGREVALRKKELEAATLHFSPEERQAMIQKLTDMNAAEAGETSTVTITEGLAPI